MNIGGYKINIPHGLPKNGDELIRGAGGILNLLLVIGVILSLAFIIYGGYLWMSSQGDKTKIDSARSTLVYAIAGLLVMFLSLFVVYVLGVIFGSDTLFFTPQKSPRVINPGPCIGAECEVR